jgi:hypothetical protein
MKLFGCHFCENRDIIIISHLYVSGLTAMHTFDAILVLLPEQQTILFAHINLLVVYTETGHNLFRLVQVFRHVMHHQDEISNQLDDIVVALIREAVL